MTKFISALIAAAAAFSACQIESPEIANEPGEEMITVNFSAEEPETRTVFGEFSSPSFPVLWTRNQKVRIFPSTSYDNAIDATVVPSRNQLKATFKGEISIPSSTARASFALLSPASAFSGNQGGTVVKITVPTNQFPTETSTDESAQILVDRTEIFRPVPDKVTFHPSHLTAYLAIKFENVPSSLGKNLVCEVAAPVSIPLSGTVEYNFTESTITPVTTSNTVKAAVVSPSGVCFIATLPAKLGGKNIKVTLRGALGSVSKTILVPSRKYLKQGIISAMTIDFTQTVAPTGVTVSPTSLELNAGGSATLTATVSPSNASDKTVTWRSLNSAVADVSTDGVVTAKSAGTTTIEASTSNGKTATCAVTVKNPATRVELLIRRPDNTDYSYDAEEDAYHMSTGGAKNLNYMVYYADGSSKVNSGAELSVISGSGISITTDGQGVLCTAAGKTAVVRVKSTTTPSVYTDLTIKTWDPVQSITLSQDNGFLDDKSAGWVKEGKYVILYATISPSTARQKAVCTVEENVGGFTVTRNSNTSFKVQAPYINGQTLDDYLLKHVNLKILDQTAKKSVTQQIVPTNLELARPKLFDVIAYNEAQSDYEVLDGGLRVIIYNRLSNNLISGVKDFYCDEEKANYSFSSGFVPVGVVTEYDESINIPCSTLGSSSRPYVEYNVGRYYHFSLSNLSFHGFAIALNDCADTYWSSSNTLPELSEHWNTSIGRTDTEQSNKAFDLTVLAAYYNGAMSSRYTIWPADRAWRYTAPGFEYDVTAWPGSVTPYKMRPWVVPTSYNFSTLCGVGMNAATIDSDVLKILNIRISRLGGTKLFQSADDYYWTINTDSWQAGDYSHAVARGMTGGSVRQKSDVLKFRPFMVF